MKIALIQLTSGSDIAANIAKIEKLVKKAAGQGAEFIALPENAFYMRAEGQAAPPKYIQSNHPGIKAAAQMAKQYGVWLLAGSVAVLSDSSPSRGEVRRGEVRRGAQFAPAEQECPHPGPPPAGEGKSYNRSLLFNPQGKIVAGYDKIHLFDVQIGDGQVYRESARFMSGKGAVVAKMVLSASSLVLGKKNLPSTKHQALSTKLGLTVCYDLRFPQLYRALAKAGAEIIAVPSAFTAVTGEAHWHVLLRARAIENACFIIAPAQTGEHPGGRQTYGHSLIIDPWGKILADGGTKEGIVMAEIDLDEVRKVRQKLPSLQHDRKFTI